MKTKKTYPYPFSHHPTPNSLPVFPWAETPSRSTEWRRSSSLNAPPPPPPPPPPPRPSHLPSPGTSPAVKRRGGSILSLQPQQHQTRPPALATHTTRTTTFRDWSDKPKTVIYLTSPCPVPIPVDGRDRLKPVSMLGEGIPTAAPRRLAEHPYRDASAEALDRQVTRI